MPPPAGVYLFLLGLAAGITLLTITAYRHTSPIWLRVLLIASGLFTISRYATLALFTSQDAPQRFWSLRHCWLASSIGLTLPSVFAVDALIRHPAMTAKKLLRLYSPFLAVYAAVVFCGRLTAMPDRMAGWTLQLSPGWQVVLAVTQSVFVIGFIGLCAMMIRKIPVASIQRALLLLAAGQAYLASDGLLLVFGQWYAWPFLYSEILMLLAIWYAYETSVALQQHA